MGYLKVHKWQGLRSFFKEILCFLCFFFSYVISTSVLKYSHLVNKLASEPEPYENLNGLCLTSETQQVQLQEIKKGGIVSYTPFHTFPTEGQHKETFHQSQKYSRRIMSIGVHHAPGFWILFFCCGTQRWMWMVMICYIHTNKWCIRFHYGFHNGACRFLKFAISP